MSNYQAIKTEQKEFLSHLKDLNAPDYLTAVIKNREFTRSHFFQAQKPDLVACYLAHFLGDDKTFVATLFSIVREYGMSIKSEVQCLFFKICKNYYADRCSEGEFNNALNHIHSLLKENEGNKGIYYQLRSLHDLGTYLMLLKGDMNEFLPGAAFDILRSCLESVWFNAEESLESEADAKIEINKTFLRKFYYPKGWLPKM